MNEGQPITVTETPRASGVTRLDSSRRINTLSAPRRWATGLTLVAAGAVAAAGGGVHAQGFPEREGYPSTSPSGDPLIGRACPTPEASPIIVSPSPEATTLLGVTGGGIALAQGEPVDPSIDPNKGTAVALDCIPEGDPEEALAAVTRLIDQDSSQVAKVGKRAILVQIDNVFTLSGDTLGTFVIPYSDGTVISKTDFDKGVNSLFNKKKPYQERLLIGSALVGEALAGLTVEDDPVKEAEIEQLGDMIYDATATQVKIPEEAGDIRTIINGYIQQNVEFNLTPES